MLFYFSAHPCDPRRKQARRLLRAQRRLRRASAARIGRPGWPYGAWTLSPGAPNPMAATQQPNARSHSPTSLAWGPDKGTSKTHPHTRLRNAKPRDEARIQATKRPHMPTPNLGQHDRMSWRTISRRAQTHQSSNSQCCACAPPSRGRLPSPNNTEHIGQCICEGALVCLQEAGRASDTHHRGLHPPLRNHKPLAGITSAKRSAGPWHIQMWPAKGTCSQLWPDTSAARYIGFRIWVGRQARDRGT